MNGEGEIMEMPAEVDFSDSIPNPYIAKARRETMKTVVNEAAVISDGAVGVRRK